MVVACPERVVALIEAARASAELRSQAMTNQLLMINGVFHARDHNDPLTAAFEQQSCSSTFAYPQRANVPAASGSPIDRE